MNALQWIFEFIFFCCIFLIASTTDNWKGLPQRGSIEQILLDVLKKRILFAKILCRNELFKITQLSSYWPEFCTAGCQRQIDEWSKNVNGNRIILEQNRRECKETYKVKKGM